MLYKIMAAICILIMVTGIFSVRDIESRSLKNTCSNEAGVSQPGVFNSPEILSVVKGAVEDDSWLYARSKDEVKLILSNYYRGSLLDKLTEDVWNFIKEPTDWYSKASVKSCNMEYGDTGRAIVYAVIDVEDVLTGSRQQGSAVFTLEKQNEGWRVIYSSYRWTASA